MVGSWGTPCSVHGSVLHHEFLINCCTFECGCRNQHLANRPSCVYMVLICIMYLSATVAYLNVVVETNTLPTISNEQVVPTVKSFYLHCHCKIYSKVNLTQAHSGLMDMCCTQVHLNLEFCELKPATRRSGPRLRTGDVLRSD